MAKNVLHMSTNKPMSLLIFEKYDADKSGTWVLASWIFGI